MPLESDQQKKRNGPPGRSVFIDSLSLSTRPFLSIETDLPTFFFSFLVQLCCVAQQCRVVASDRPSLCLNGRTKRKGTDSPPSCRRSVRQSSLSIEDESLIWNLSSVGNSERLWGPARSSFPSKHPPTRIHCCCCVRHLSSSPTIILATRHDDDPRDYDTRLNSLYPIQPSMTQISLNCWLSHQE